MLDRFIVGIAVIVGVIGASCIGLDFDGEDGPKDDKEFGAPGLFTEYESIGQNKFDSIGYNEYRVTWFYRVDGTTYNRGSATAHNAYAHIVFKNPSGAILHEHDEQLGDIGPLEERSFSYDWIYDWTAKAEVKSYCDEIPRF